MMGQYTNSVLAKPRPSSAGYDEAILLDTQGYVSEGSGENIFIVKKGRLVTPPLSSSILEGITRDTVLTLAREEGIPVIEERITRDQLYLADEAFFTGTAAEVTPDSRGRQPRHRRRQGRARSPSGSRRATSTSSKGATRAIPNGTPASNVARRLGALALAARAPLCGAAPARGPAPAAAPAAAAEPARVSRSRGRAGGTSIPSASSSRWGFPMGPRGGSTITRPLGSSRPMTPSRSSLRLRSWAEEALVTRKACYAQGARRGNRSCPISRRCTSSMIRRAAFGKAMDARVVVGLESDRRGADQANVGLCHCGWRFHPEVHDRRVPDRGGAPRRNRGQARGRLRSAASARSSSMTLRSHTRANLPAPR